jgi:hypothetical protein
MPGTRLNVKEQIFGFSADITLKNFTEEQRAQTAVALIALARATAPLPSVFDTHPPFFWPALISNNKVDSYYTRMHPTSLKNYAEDANAGVSFQNSHRTREFMLGRSLRAEMKVEPGALVMADEYGGETEDLVSVAADFYTISDLILSEVNTSQFILGVNAGLINDVSIGFFGGDFICSICALDLWDWDCPHIPGFSYNITDASGNLTGQRTAFAWVMEAHLAEVSAVYKGATPGAAIIKAQLETESGRIRPEQTAFIQRRYRTLLSERDVQISLAGLHFKEADMGTTATPPGSGQGAGNRETPAPPAPTPPPTDNPPPAQPQPPQDRAAGEQTETARVLELCRAILNDTETANAELCVGFRAMLANETNFRALVSLARDGRTYREDLIQEALKQGGRALGTEFKSADYLPTLRGGDITLIKRMSDDWKRMADNQLPAGRRTNQGEQGTEEAATGPVVPAEMPEHERATYR